MGKKRKYLKFQIVFMIGILFLLSACQNKSEESYNKAVARGLDSLIAKDYDKAEVYFKIALEEKHDDKVENILNQTLNFNEAKKLMEDEKLTEAGETAEKVLKFSDGSEALEKKAKSLINEVESYKSIKKKFQTKFNEAQNLFDNKNNYDALSIINEILEEEQINKDYYSDIKENIETLKGYIEKELLVIRMQEEEEANDLQELPSNNYDEFNENTQLLDDETAKQVEAYRNQPWYAKGEDPDYTYDNALEIIRSVIGPEDQLFFYNGRMSVSMDDLGRRFYIIWQEDKGGENIAEATIASYYVFEDGTIEEY